MKTILFADWYLSPIPQSVINYLRLMDSPFHTVIADDLIEAVEILPTIKPELVVSQPAIYCMESFRLLKAIQAQEPVPPILVWGSDTVIPLFREMLHHPAPVRYLPMPFALEGIVRHATELLESTDGTLVV